MKQQFEVDMQEYNACLLYTSHFNIKGTYYQNAQSVFRLRNSAA